VKVALKPTAVTGTGNGATRRPTLPDSEPEPAPTAHPLTDWAKTAETPKVGVWATKARGVNLVLNYSEHGYIEVQVPLPDAWRVAQKLVDLAYWVNPSYRPPG
jgi:hypothetical protein